MAMANDSSSETAPSKIRSARVDQFHDQAVRTYVMQCADVRMVQRCHYSGFALEPLGELFGGDFDRDIAIEARIAGSEHFTHASGAD